MRVTLNNKPEGFQPIAVTLHIETQEEFDAMKKFYGFNTSIPQYATGEGHLNFHEEEIVSDMMGDVFNKLCTAVD